MIRLSLNSHSGAVGVTLGWLMLIMGVFMGGHAIWAFCGGESSVYAFSISSWIAIFIGGLSVCAFSSKEMGTFSMRQSFFLTLVSWTMVSYISALPFYFSDMRLSMLDALFESASVLTTTGFSLLPDQAYFCKTLKFWRVFLQWFGGFGIVMTVVVMLPILRIGGSQLMSAEFSDHSKKIAPRSATMAGYLMALYGFFTLFFMVCLFVFGRLPWWDSLTYSMATLSTGGVPMSEYGVFDLPSSAKIIISLSMLCGSMTLVLWIGAFRGHWRNLFWDDQWIGLLKILGIAFIFALLWHPNHSWLNVLVMSISAVSSTGLSTEGAFHCGGLFLIVTFIGGCSGSTAGGIKVFRLQVLYRMAKSHMNRCLDPYGFFPTIYNNHNIEDQELSALVAVVFFYISGWIVSMTALMFCGYQLGDAFSLASSALTNSGVNFGNWSSHIAEFSTPTKWVTIITMLCGRFECVTLVGALWSLIRR
jgi:trk system potassium uptake protein TrkH